MKRNLIIHEDVVQEGIAKYLFDSLPFDFVPSRGDGKNFVVSEEYFEFEFFPIGSEGIWVPYKGEKFERFSQAEKLRGLVRSEEVFWHLREKVKYYSSCCPGILEHEVKVNLYGRPCNGMPSHLQ